MPACPEILLRRPTLSPGNAQTEDFLRMSEMASFCSAVVPPSNFSEGGRRVATSADPTAYAGRFIDAAASCRESGIETDDRPHAPARVSRLPDDQRRGDRKPK